MCEICRQQDLQYGNGDCITQGADLKFVTSNVLISVDQNIYTFYDPIERADLAYNETGISQASMFSIDLETTVKLKVSRPAKLAPMVGYKSPV